MFRFADIIEYAKNIKELMKSMLYACASVSLSLSSGMAMKKEGGDKKRAEKLAHNIFARWNALDILEENWKKGGDMAQFYPLNEHNSFYVGNILAAALRCNKSADFITYLIQSGADVNLEFDKDMYCLPIALASLHGNPAIVSTIIELGGLQVIKKLAKAPKSNDRGASLLIRFIREAKKDKKGLASYVVCLNHLIKAGCAVEQKKVGELEEVAYISLLGLPLVLNGSPYSDYSRKFTTPLIEAVRLKMPEIAKLLIKSGANPDKEYSGKSARNIAKEKGLLKKAVSLLKKTKKKNIIELAEDEIKADEAKVLEEEGLKQEKAKFEKEKDTYAIPRLTSYLSIDQKYIKLETLLRLNRT